ncbi:OLC1v1028908C1 [Oldenlandia corymbosa var. corymbosa]|uniref:Trehalase n=1 Tax=Oldenlandia corymbosa var. corymbosa TaxID=529605 RepID=A0AAV1CD79_OLDCO|nr:OLC1v1028908C1 [Oldenlandia corymbosa var. corymbosa]
MGSHHSSLFIIIIILLFSSLLVSMTASSCVPTDAGPVVKTTPLVSFLERLQELAFQTYGPKNFDPKLYVDMSLKQSLEKTEEGFRSLVKSGNGSVSVADLDGFVKEYMEGADEDLVYSEPVDFVDVPDGFLPGVLNAEIRDWALEVHSLWKNLTRKVSERVLEKPDFHTLLPLKEAVIVPGSRFREVYYWDSYWVIRGLLASKMYETAKGIVANLISLINQYGYVLNGARAYYTNRSQPPLLTSMVFDIYNRTGDIQFLRNSLPPLLTEYEFWNSGIHRVTIKDSKGEIHNLNRYYAQWNTPRPESSTIDKETASKLPNDCEKTQLYRELASAAESGWDFSTRWMRNGSDLTTLWITSIVPVDLNAFILKMELDIAFLANVIGEKSTAERFREASLTRQKAMNSILWNKEMGQWLDYWLTKGNTPKDGDFYNWEASNQNKQPFASNFIPLWISLFHSVMESFQASGLLQPAGIATSLTNSGQQWDFPNGWAPLQQMIAEGLANYGTEESKSLAQEISSRWIRTNYVAFKKTGTMHEKYDVEKCGSYGGGGEYTPQTGFGWSNGVVLAFLEQFGWPKDMKVDC